MEVKVYFIIHVSILWKFGLRLGWGLHPPRFWYNDHANMLNNIPPGTCVGIRIRPVLVIRSGYGATAVPRCLCNYMRWTSVRLENILRSWTLEGDAWDSVNVNVTDTKNATFTFHFIPCNALVKTFLTHLRMSIWPSENLSKKKLEKKWLRFRPSHELERCISR